MRWEEMKSFLSDLRKKYNTDFLPLWVVFHEARKKKLEVMEVRNALRFLHKKGDIDLEDGRIVINFSG
jgi:hypothetical protein